MAVAVTAAAFVSLVVIVVGLTDAPERDRGRRLALARRGTDGACGVTMPGVGRKSIAGIVAALLVVDVLVASVLAMPGPAPWLLAGVLLTVLGAVVLRAEYERQRLDWLERTQPVEADDLPEPTGVALARFLYFAGTATIGILLLRPGGASASDLLYLAVARRGRGGADRDERQSVGADAEGPRRRRARVLRGRADHGVLRAVGDDNLGVLFRVTYLVAIWFWLGTMVLTRAAPRADRDALVGRLGRRRERRRRRPDAVRRRHPGRRPSTTGA